MHVLVAGAGISGLAAALRLAESGAEVTVVERTERIGGMLRTSTFAGRPVDEGADAFLIRVPHALDLAHRVGLGAALVHPARREAHVWHEGALRPLPPHLMGVPVDLDAVERSGLLSAAGVERLRCDLTDPASPLPDTDTDIAAALGARIGTEALAVLVDPLVGGINGGDTARQSLAAVVPQLDAARRDPDHPSLIEACRSQIERARRAGADPEAPIFAAPRGGMARFPAAVGAAARATGRVAIRLGVGVESVEPGPRVSLSDGSTVSVDGVVIAAPGPAAASVLGSLSGEAAELIGGVDHVSVAFLRLAVPVDAVGRALDGSGVLVPRTAGLAVTAVSWASSKWAHLAPDAVNGTVVLRAAVGRDGDQAVLDRDDRDLAERVVEDLTPMLGLSEGPSQVDVVRWNRAFPQYRPGHLDRVAAAEAALAAAAPSVAVAGMYLRGVGIPAGVASGQAAATRVLAALA